MTYSCKVDLAVSVPIPDLLVFCLTVSGGKFSGGTFSFAASTLLSSTAGELLSWLIIAGKITIKNLLL